MASRLVATISAVLLLASCGSATLRSPDGSAGSGGASQSGGAGGRGGGVGAAGTSGALGTGGTVASGGSSGNGGSLGGRGGASGAAGTGGTAGGGLAGKGGAGGGAGTGGNASGGTGGGCASVANGTPCNDGDACTQTDTCQSGACVGGNPVICPVGTCKVAGICDPSTGVCSPQTSAGNSTSCSDGDACTQGDSCQGGQCVGTQILCNSPPACKLNTTCSAGNCNYTQSVPDGTMDSKCGSATPYCYAGGCVRCTMDAHCSGATPSCDPATHTCVCRQPSSTNRLTNPGFDGSFSGWTVLNAILTADSEACPGSNSVYVDNSEEDPEQCFALTPGAYYLGGRFNGGSAGNFFRVYFYPGANCTGTSIDSFDFNLSGYTSWTSAFTDMTVPANTLSAHIGFLGLQQYFDQLYINTSNRF